MSLLTLCSLTSLFAQIPKFEGRERPVYLTLPQVVARYEGRWSKWTIYEWTRAGRIPHRKMPGRRQLVFPLAELEAFEDGCELETVRLPDGGRICRPVGR